MAEQVHDTTKSAIVRLPTSFKPIHYDLTVKPDLKKFTYDGSVRIKYSLDKSALNSPVLVHSTECEISEGSMSALDKSLPLKRVTYNKEAETASLDFGEQPLFQDGTILLKFRGTLNDKMKGFYRTEFKLNDKTVYAATTQFESTDARRCFPCVDEPAAKATFSVTMIYEQPQDGPQLTALSNTPVISNKVQGQEVEVKFSDTPIMSTYLLAFILGPFE